MNHGEQCGAPSISSSGCILRNGAVVEILPQACATRGVMPEFALLATVFLQGLLRTVARRQTPYVLTVIFPLHRVRNGIGALRQRRATADMSRRHEAATSKLENCRLALQNMRIDLVRLRTGSGGSPLQVTSVAERAMALAREVDGIVGAAEEVRGAVGAA